MQRVVREVRVADNNRRITYCRLAFAIWLPHILASAERKIGQFFHMCGKTSARAKDVLPEWNNRTFSIIHDRQRSSLSSNFDMPGLWTCAVQGNQGNLSDQQADTWYMNTFVFNFLANRAKWTMWGLFPYCSFVNRPIYLPYPPRTWCCTSTYCGKYVSNVLLKNSWVNWEAMFYSFAPEVPPQFARPFISKNGFARAFLTP